ncbi:unnamed protein product [Linum trigynum]|uniref:Uncharacterized protein n=1 Tax=Linum trigynum TaxID=586398 RepID=A0AAV2DA85_9ROSI
MEERGEKELIAKTIHMEVNVDLVIGNSSPPPLIKSNSAVPVQNENLRQPVCSLNSDVEKFANGDYWITQSSNRDTFVTGISSLDLFTERT